MSLYSCLAKKMDTPSIEKEMRDLVKKELRVYPLTYQNMFFLCTFGNILTDFLEYTLGKVFFYRLCLVRDIYIFSPQIPLILKAK